MFSIRTTQDISGLQDGSERRLADRHFVEQSTQVICRSAGPNSPLVTHQGLLADISWEGAKLVCQDRVLHGAIWLRFTPPGDVERILEADIQWSRAAGDGPDHGWVYGIRFTATLTTELVDRLLIEQLRETTGGSASVLDDEESPAAAPTVGDTQIWFDNRVNLMADYLQSQPRPSVVRPDSFALQGLFHAPSAGERRISPRFSVERTGYVRTSVDSEHLAPIVTEDISEHGAKITCAEPLPGKTVILHLPSVAGTRSTLECEIRWRSEEVEGMFCQETRHVYGLRFLAPLPASVVKSLQG